MGFNIRLLLRELLDLRFRGRGRNGGGVCTGHFLQNRIRKVDLNARRSIVGFRLRNGSLRRVSKSVVGCRVCRFVKIAVGGSKQEGAVGGERRTRGDSGHAACSLTWSIIG